MAVKDVLWPMKEQLKSNLVLKVETALCVRGMESAAAVLEKLGIPAAPSREEDEYLRVIAGYWAERGNPIQGKNPTISPEQIEEVFGVAFDVSRITSSIGDIREKLGPKKEKPLPNARIYDNSGAWKPAQFDRDDFKTNLYRS